MIEEDVMLRKNVLLAMILVCVGFMSALNASAQGEEYVEASLNNDWFGGHGFSGTVEVTIYHPPPDTSIIAFHGFVDADGNGDFRLERDILELDLQVGSRFVADDGTHLRKLILEYVHVEGRNLADDTVWGAKASDSTMRVQIGDETQSYSLFVSDVGETWVVDFSESDVEIEEWYWVGAMIHDEDDDLSIAEWPPPLIRANTSNNWVEVQGYPPYSVVDMTVFDSQEETEICSGSEPTDLWGNVRFNCWENGLEAGNIVVADDGVTPKEITLEHLTVDDVNFETDVVEGTSPASVNIRVEVCTPEWGCSEVRTTAGTGGAWAVVSPIVLTPDSYVAAFLTEDDGDATMAEPMQPEPPPEFGLDTWSVALGDLDGDFDLDAFVGNSGYNQVWFNNGGAFFEDSGQELGDADTWAVALADLDGDFDLDVYVGNTAGESSGGPGAENTIWLNDGNGNFTDTGQRLGDSASEAVALGDIDGDGDVDAFVANTAEQGDANTVWENKGGGVFTLVQSLGDSASFGVALGDLDGDLDLDAFVANMGENRVWFNDGIGNFTDSGQGFGPAQAREVVLGDFDDDGDLDAFVVSHFSEGINVWLNNGAGIFENGQYLENLDTVSLAMADLDGDGDTDAFIGNFGDSNQILLNEGLPDFFVDGQFLDDGDFSEAVALGDLDGDSDIDAFVGNSFGQPNKVWLNDGTGHFEDTGQRMNGGVEVQSNFEVHPFAEQVTAWNWPSGDPVTLTIDDPSNGEGVDHTDVQTPEPTEWNPDETFLLFDFYGVFNVSAGHIVTLTQSDVVSTHVVTQLAVTDFDLVTKIFSGSAAPDSDVYAWTCDDDICYDRHEVAEGGLWSLDFSVPGDEEGEEDPYPYPMMPWIDVAQWDEWGNATYVSLQNPRIQAWPEYRSIEGFEWPRGTLVELSINGELIDSGEVGLASWDDQTRWIEFHVPEEVDLFPGSHVQLTGGGLTKDLFISALEVADADVEADVLTGTVEGEGRVLIIPHEDWESQIEAIIDPPGVWTAYFAGMYNVNPGSGFNVIQEDFDGDGTWFDWWVPMPLIEVFDGVKAFEFTPNASVTITVYDTDGNMVFGPESRSTNEEGYHYSHYTTLGCHYMQTGDFVVVTDDVTGFTKTLLVAELEIEGVDPVFDTVSGKADPEAIFWLHVDDVDGGFGMEVTTDPSGQWVADFATSDHDVPIAAKAHAWLGDEDGDVTMHTLPNYRSPDYVRVVPLWDGANYTVCPGQAAKLHWGWSEQSEPLVEEFLFAIDNHSYVLDGIPLFSSPSDANALFGPIEISSPNEYCGWPISYVSRWDLELFDLEPGEHSLVTNLTLTHPVPDTCEGGLSPVEWVNRTVTLNVVPGPNDDDADGIDNTVDNCPGTPNRDQADFDQDGMGDKCDPDDDNDGVPDSGDSCPLEDSTDLDADGNGCIDTHEGLLQIIDTSEDEDISDKIKNSLASKIENALKSLDKGRENAAIGQLEAFINQVEAQRGKKISDETADLLISYAENLISQIEGG